MIATLLRFNDRRIPVFQKNLLLPSSGHKKDVEVVGYLEASVTIYQSSTNKQKKKETNYGALVHQRTTSTNLQGFNYYNTIILIFALVQNLKSHIVYLITLFCVRYRPGINTYITVLHWLIGSAVFCLEFCWFGYGDDDGILFMGGTVEGEILYGFKISTRRQRGNTLKNRDKISTYRCSR